MNKDIDHITLLNDRQVRATAERIVLHSGIRADLKGFAYITNATILYINGVCGFNDIYRKLSTVHNVNDRTVMREITYAINSSSNILGKLSRLTGKTYDETVRCNNSFIIKELAEVYAATSEAAASRDPSPAD